MAYVRNAYGLSSSFQRFQTKMVSDTIIHLRAVTAIKLDDVALHSKLPSTYVAEPDKPYVRIGRFVDHLRFSIAQRAMLLFSRIGLNSSFEADAKTAIDMIVEGYIQ